MDSLLLTWCSEPRGPARSLQHLSVVSLRLSSLELYSPHHLPSWNGSTENLNQPTAGIRPSVQHPSHLKIKKQRVTFITSPLLCKPVKSLKQADYEIMTYHSHFGEIDKAFLSKVRCSFFNKCQVCQVHSQIRNSWGVTAARPRGTVFMLVYANVHFPSQFNRKQLCCFSLK